MEPGRTGHRLTGEPMPHLHLPPSPAGPVYVLMMQFREDDQLHAELHARGLRASGLHMVRPEPPEHYQDQRFKDMAPLDRLAIEAREVSGVQVGLPLELPGSSERMRERLEDGSFRVEPVCNMWEVLRLTLQKEPIGEGRAGGQAGEAFPLPH